MEESRRTCLSEVFLELNLPREARILDVACGTGIVAEELRPHGYDNMDGLDPVKGYLETAQHKNLYRVSASSAREPPSGIQYKSLSTLSDKARNQLKGEF